MNSLKLSSFFSFTLILLLVSSCSKDIDLPNADAEKLIGNWLWINSSGGFSGAIINPSTEGYTKKVEFRKDGLYAEFRNDKVVENTQFLILKDESIRSAYEVYQINYVYSNGQSNIFKQSFNFQGNDTLILMDECYDCYTHIYIRE